MLAALAVVALASCAAPSGGWQQPAKNDALTKADYAACQARAEESSLEISRAERSGYGMTDGPGPFNPRGDNPMAIAERSNTATVYNALLANCMIQKGYRRPQND